MTDSTIVVHALIVEASSGFFWALTKHGERRKAANGWMATRDIETVRRVIMVTTTALFGAHAEVHFD